MTRIVFSAGIVAVALLASSAAAQQSVPMVAAVGSNMNHVPSFVGVEKGIFLKHGIDLKLKVLATGQEMAKALEAGDAQIIGSAYSNYPIAVERGMAAKGVVGLMGDRTSRYSDEPVSIWTRKGTGITRIEDLVGRKVGTPVGGTADEYLTAVLAKKGLSRDKVNILNVPPGSLVGAMRGGSVEAVAVWEPFGSQVQTKVPDAILVARDGGYIGYYINMAVANDLIGKSPELVERYVLGMAEADQYTREHPDEAAEIATRWIPGLDVAVAKDAIRHMTFDPRITRYTLAAWDDNVKILMEQKKLRSAVPWQQGIEPRFIESAMKTHPELFNDLKLVP
jgi:sulfonate transport system substrate-binding protein